MDTRTNRHVSTRTLVLAMASGAAAGAAVAMLFAPKRGRDLRRQIVDTTRRATEHATTRVNGASLAMADVMTRGRRAIEAGRQAYRAPRPVERPHAVQ